MKVRILYRPNSEHDLKVQHFIRDIEHHHHVSVDLMSLNEREGVEFARIYDIVQYPAIIVTEDDGHLIKMWSGLPFPLMREVAYYAPR